MLQLSCMFGESKQNICWTIVSYGIDDIVNEHKDEK